MVAIKQELAPNSRAVRMEVGWGEVIHDPPRVSKGQSGGGSQSCRVWSRRGDASHPPLSLHSSRALDAAPDSTALTPVLLHASRGPARFL